MPPRVRESEGLEKAGTEQVVKVKSLPTEVPVSTWFIALPVPKQDGKNQECSSLTPPACSVTGYRAPRTATDHHVFQSQRAESSF